MTLFKKAMVVSGFVSAGFVSYLATNAAFEDKRGVAIFNPHKHLGLYVVDIAMGIVGATVNYALASCGDLYRTSNHDVSAVGQIRLRRPSNPY